MQKSIFRFSNILIFVIVLTFSSIVAEATLRFIDSFKVVAGEHDVLNYEYHYITTLNSFGFRDEEFVKEKNEDIIRIFLIGDSFVYSPGSNDDFKIDRLLEDKLNEGQKRYEVFNIGLPHADTETYIGLAKKFAEYDPDLVILSLYLDNDIKKFNLDKILNLRIVESLGTLKTKIRNFLIKDIDDKYDKLLAGRKINPFLIDRAGVGDNQKYYDFFVKEFTEYSTVKNNILKVKEIYSDVPFMLLINPSKYQASAEYFAELRKLGFVFNEDKVVDNTLQQAISSWAEKNNINVVDVLPQMIDSDVLHYHLIDDHYNDNGNQLVAEELYREIK